MLLVQLVSQLLLEMQYTDMCSVYVLLVATKYSAYLGNKKVDYARKGKCFLLNASEFEDEPLRAKERVDFSYEQHI